jgi:hypothetical protein
MARNIFAQEGSWLPNVQAGADFANQFDDRIRSRRASTRAAPMIASGDYQGAAGVYGEMGLADETMALEGQARTRQRQGMADERQAAQDKRQETTDERELVKARVEGLRGIMQDIANVPQGQRLGAWRRRAPELVAQGYPQEAVDSQTEADLSDAELQAFGAQLEEEWQAVNLGAGGFASFNKRSNTFDVKREPDPRLLVLGEGRVAVDPKTRQVVAKGPDKTFAPRAPSGAAGLPPPPSGWAPVSR